MKLFRIKLILLATLWLTLVTGRADIIQRSTQGRLVMTHGKLVEVDEDGEAEEPLTQQRHVFRTGQVRSQVNQWQQQQQHGAIQQQNQQHTVARLVTQLAQNQREFQQFSDKLNQQQQTQQQGNQQHTADRLAQQLSRQQQEYDKLLQQQQSQSFEEPDDPVEQNYQQQTTIQSENLIQQGSTTNLVSELRKEFLGFKEETKTLHSTLNKTISALEQDVSQCREDLKVEQEEIKRLTALIKALDAKLRALEEKVAQKDCPSCVEAIKLQLTGLVESYQSTVPQLSLDVSSLQVQVQITKDELQRHKKDSLGLVESYQSTVPQLRLDVSKLQAQIQTSKDELEKHKKDTLGGFSSHAEIAQLLKQTSSALANTAQSFNASVQIVLRSQKIQEEAATNANLCAARPSEKLVKEDFTTSLPVKSDAERSEFNRLARLVASKDALKISAGHCPRQLGHNSNALCAEIRNSCYCVVTSHLANWFEAERYCRWFGMTLATIESEEENDAVYVFAKSRGDNHYWIGATDRGHEGLWVWSGTETPLGRYRNWVSNQPDNWKGQNSEGENCMELGNEFRNRWNDRACTIQRNFICETTQTGSSTTATTAPGQLVGGVKTGVKS